MSAALSPEPEAAAPGSTCTSVPKPPGPALRPGARSKGKIPQ
ncbi:hypothetical protein [Xanthobacter sediminis]